MNRNTDELDRYYLSPEQRRALWENELAMFIVLALPLVVAAFWYGSTVRMVDIYGHVTVPASISRGIGVAITAFIIAALAGATYLFIQPAEVRFRNGQPVRNPRRLSYALFVGFLVGVNTAQSLIDGQLQTDVTADAIGLVLGGIAALIAYVAMSSMVEIPPEPAPMAVGSDARVRGAR